MASPTSSTRITVDRLGGDHAPGLYRAEHTATPLGGPREVGAEQLGSYRREGYLAVGGLLDTGQIDGALDGLSALADPASGANVQFEAWAADRLEELSPAQRLDGIRRCIRFAGLDDRLDAVSRHPELLRIARELLGGEPVMFQDMALLKPPGGGREKPWHQDNAFFALRPGTPIVGVWIALDAATAENGCMHIVPGSHREGPRRHVRLRDLQICDAEVPTLRTTAVPLEPGGALFFDGLTLHGTPPNTSTTRRRALQFHYTLADVDRVTEDEHRADFGIDPGAEC